eukprot:g180.t1
MGDGYSTSVPTEFIAITDHSINLVPKNESMPIRQWKSDNSGFSSTNWGGTSGKTMAQAYSGHLGQIIRETTGNDATRSHLGMGYISYFVKEDDVDIRENQFFTMMGSVGYYMNGCANYKPGQTSESEGYSCPAKPVNAGDFKFSVLGMLSGTQINSGHSTFPSNFNPMSDSEKTNYADIAKYKTMLYRTTLDVSNMADADMWVELPNGTEVKFADVDENLDIAGGKLHVNGPIAGDIVVSFSPTYSTGRFTRDFQGIVDEFGGYPCDMNTGGMDSCLRDLTGWEEAPDSFPIGANIGVKKLGKGGLAQMPSFDCGMDDCSTTAYDGATETPKTSTKDLKSLAGAPALTVTEVRNMKITMRPSGICDGGVGVDCPWWMSGNNVNIEERKKMSNCKNEGDCWLIDFHIELEDEDGQRTVFGNPENDIERGWLKGSFFMYDPEVSTPQGSGSGLALDTWVIVLIIVGGVLVLGIIVGAVIAFTKKSKSKNVAPEN